MEIVSRISSRGRDRRYPPVGVRFRGDNVGYLFVTPALLFLVLIMVFPLGYAVFLAFHETQPQSGLKFVGVSNFARALGDPAFWNSMRITVGFTGVSVVLHMSLGLGLALLLNQGQRGTGVFRFLLLIPWMVSQVVAGVIWRWILNAQYGVANAVLVKLHLARNYLPWLADVRLSQISIVVAYAWQCIPFAMIMLYAGLQTIPQEQYEAARIDGATGIQVFRYVTIPNLRHVIVVTSLMDFIWAFRAFDLVKIMTDGGPMRLTELLSILVYRTTFQYYDFGYASAIAILMLMVVLAFSLVYTRIAMPED